jgi:hypothetical protein
LDPGPSLDAVLGRVQNGVQPSYDRIEAPDMIIRVTQEGAMSYF